MYWVVFDYQHTVFLNLEGSNSVSKAIVLTINPRIPTELRYESIRLIDGITRFADVEGWYASIVLQNSVYLTEIHKKGINVYKYMETPKVNNVKMYYNGEKAWMVFTQNEYILGEYIKGTNGFLICDTTGTKGSYTFSVLGLTNHCGLDDTGESIKKCYYEAKVTLQISEYTYAETVTKTKNQWIMYGVIIGIILIIMIVVLVIVIVKYKQASHLLNEYVKQSNSDKGTSDQFVIKLPAPE